MSSGPASPEKVEPGAVAGPAPPAGSPTGTPAPLTSKFAFNTLIVFLNAVGGQFLGWIATHELFVRVAHGSADTVGLGYLGIATLYILISSMVYTLGDLRVGTAYVFFVARGGKAANLTSAYLLFRFLSLGAVALGFALLTPVLAPALGFTLAAGMLPLDLFLLLPLIQTPSFVYSALASARGKAAEGVWPFVIENILRAGGLIVVAFLWTDAPSLAGSTMNLLAIHPTVQLVGAGIVTDIALAYIVAAIVPFFLLFVHSRISPLGLYRGMSFRGSGSEIRTMLVFAAPLIGAMFLSYAVSSLPPFFVAAAYPTDQGYVQAFASANAFLLLLMFLPNAITVPLFPDMASLFVRGEHRELRRRTRKSLRWTVLILAPAILACIVFRRILLNDLYSAVVSTGPYDAEYALAILAASVLPQALFRITGSVLDAVGQQKRELYLSTIQLVVLTASLVGFLWPTSPLRALGITGAALAVFLSMSAGFLANAWYLHKYVRVHPSPRPYITIVLAAAATFLIFSRTAVGDFGALFGHPELAIPVASPPVLAVTVLAGLLLYVLLLAAVGELTKEDVLELGGSLGLPAALPRLLSRLCWRESWPDPPGDERPLPAALTGMGPSPPS